MTVITQQNSLSSSKRKGRFTGTSLEGTESHNYFLPLASGHHLGDIYNTAATLEKEDGYILIAASAEPTKRYIIKYCPANEKSIRSNTLAKELDDIYRECSKANWDGYGAKRVPRNLRRTVESFLNALPAEIPDPEISADPDGEISLDWCYDKDKMFSISIGRREMSYAFIDGDRRSRGIEIFKTDIPKSINLQLNNFMSDRT